MTEDKIVGWHHGLNVHEFEQALGDCDGQGSLLISLPLLKLFGPLGGLLKQKHHFATKGQIVKAMVLPVVMFGCERWTI